MDSPGRANKRGRRRGRGSRNYPSIGRGQSPRSPSTLSPEPPQEQVTPESPSEKVQVEPQEQLSPETQKTPGARKQEKKQTVEGYQRDKEGSGENIQEKNEPTEKSNDPGQPEEEYSKPKGEVENKNPKKETTKEKQEVAVEKNPSEADPVSKAEKKSVDSKVESDSSEGKEQKEAVRPLKKKEILPDSPKEETPAPAAFKAVPPTELKDETKTGKTSTEPSPTPPKSPTAARVSEEKSETKKPTDKDDKDKKRDKPEVKEKPKRSEDIKTSKVTPSLGTDSQKTLIVTSPVVPPTEEKKVKIPQLPKSSEESKRTLSSESSRHRKITPISRAPGFVFPPIRSTFQEEDGFWVHSLSDNDDDKDVNSSTLTSKKFSMRQWITLLILGFANFFSAIAISLQGPFYPNEAESKGASPTEYGFVFGVFELIVFLVSPLYNKYMQKIGPRLVFSVGIILSAVSCIAFGFLDRFDDHGPFISLSFIIRMIEAGSTAAFVTASFTIIANEFPKSVGNIFVSFELFYGLGLVVGPTVGGILYALGGFTLPFAINGGLLLVTAILASVIMPMIHKVSSIKEDQVERPSILLILRIPGATVAAISIMVCAMSAGYLSATLEPHIRQFNLTPVQIGSVFIINGGVYALTTPGWIMLCGKIQKPQFVTLLGSFFIIIAFLLVGPATFIPLETSVWLVCVALAIHGLGIGCCWVSGFLLITREAVRHGYPENIRTYGVVSSLWTCVLSLGAFLGPSIGGVLLDYVGFREGTLFVLASSVLLALISAGYLAFGSKTSSGELPTTTEESSPLLKLPEDYEVGGGTSSGSTYGTAA